MHNFADIEIQISPETQCLIDAHNVTPQTLIERAVKRMMSHLPATANVLPQDRRSHLRIVIWETP